MVVIEQNCSYNCHWACVQGWVSCKVKHHEGQGAGAGQWKVTSSQEGGHLLTPTHPHTYTHKHIHTHKRHTHTHTHTLAHKHTHKMMAVKVRPGLQKSDTKQIGRRVYLPQSKSSLATGEREYSEWPKA